MLKEYLSFMKLRIYILIVMMMIMKNLKSKNKYRCNINKILDKIDFSKEESIGQL